MHDVTDLLRAARYECADPATLKEVEGSRRVRLLHQRLVELAAEVPEAAAVIPLRARR
ncbi:hypothetical protein HJG53_08050 [Sphingomonas sp. ID1715]|uniref:hypothetical protein n=1 Tax=Sphingomonas sp. ID1715 TaxID=1656898 RepID=UPI0014896B27|nr:hypothetical protein [Sphingomonas sp. ID1715]NNM76848.1 hypothetical protein [Sphingomonas sp. ID1715]